MNRLSIIVIIPLKMAIAQWFPSLLNSLIQIWARHPSPSLPTALFFCPHSLFLQRHHLFLSLCKQLSLIQNRKSPRILWQCSILFVASVENIVLCLRNSIVLLWGVEPWTSPCCRTLNAVWTYGMTTNTIPAWSKKTWISTTPSISAFELDYKIIDRERDRIMTRIVRIL